MPDGLVAPTASRFGIVTVLVSLLAIKVTRDMSTRWSKDGMADPCTARAAGVALA